MLHSDLKILALDQGGIPQRWITTEDSIAYHARDQVAWQLGDDEITFRGGINRLSGKQSVITTAPIVAIRGVTRGAAILSKPPMLSNRELFRRDHRMCCYCGNIFKCEDLTRDHVIPRSRGGRDAWTNVVTSCQSCNQKKDDHLLQECGMEMLYIPYAPNHAEALILENRNVLYSQMDYLKAYIPQESRVLQLMDIQ